jgi:hypothetical protein
MNLVWGFLITVGATAVAVSAMLFVRRRAPEGSYFQDGDRASGVFGVLATGFSILLGFVIFLAFTSYDQSRSGAETEALTVSQQVETAQFFPPSARERLTGELICYGQSVVHGEWAKMATRSTRGACDCSRRWRGSPRARLRSSRLTTSGSSRPRRVSRRARIASTGQSG